ncbi:uroporphyrinogen-III synthase [Ectobacillus ponti]|uniref:Uroporphyrinogen-III synthase n=1 Tax=Ectobacillus ponti TaxID=2961894 RepID=A0AA41X1P1_9BACI|nr:uroporphyrinogen-III synthase [Ectobacillus ponti]MCP8967334.1 uroporphyrinogen-III synthase [Ectobacillus ponti]
MTAPLLHKRVVITRPKGQTKAMAAAIQNWGGVPVELPLLHIVPAQLSQLSFGKYSWLIFTSQNAVRHFFAGAPFLPEHMRIAAVGSKTKLAVEAYGHSVAFVPQEFVAEAFLQEFSLLMKPGEAILFPRGDLARDVIAAGLRRQGVPVDELVVYETKPYMAMREELIHVLQDGGADMLTFTSPSAVEAFVSLLEGTNWRQWTKKCTIGCIGPVTERAAVKYFPSVVVPSEYTVEGLLAALAERVS